MYILCRSFSGTIIESADYNYIVIVKGCIFYVVLFLIQLLKVLIKSIYLLNFKDLSPIQRTFKNDYFVSNSMIVTTMEAVPSAMILQG